MDLGHNTTRN